MLYLEKAGEFVAWRGEQIEDVWYPRAIEQKWSAEQLAGIGLYSPEPADPVPEGWRVTSMTVKRVNGVVKFVPTLEDIPPEPIPTVVSARQFHMQLVLSGLKEQVEAWVAQQEEIVRVAFEKSSTFVRDEPMMQAGFQALGYSKQQGDDFFRAARLL